VGIQNAPPPVFQKSYGNYIKDKFGQANHWRYANSQPAINTILQAMGRPIRAMGDRALIVLLDRRNVDRTYSICYPPDIKMNQVSNHDGSGRFAKRFFSKVKREADI
jgi:Rad3-related DNA helicase